MIYPPSTETFDILSAEVSQQAPSSMAAIAARARGYLAGMTSKQANLEMFSLSLAVNEEIEDVLELHRNQDPELSYYWVEEDNVGALANVIDGKGYATELRDDQLFALLCLMEIGSAERWLSQSGKLMAFSETLILDPLEAYQFATANMVRATEALGCADYRQLSWTFMDKALTMAEKLSAIKKRDDYSRRALQRHNGENGYNTLSRRYCEEYLASPSLLEMPATKAADILAEKYHASPVTIVKKLRALNKQK
jgi:hypothetical protein